MNLNDYLLNSAESAASLATKLCISPVLISQWKTRSRPVPLERCTAIEQATNGSVTRKDLRPDDWHLIWPELADNPNQQDAA